MYFIFEPYSSQSTIWSETKKSIRFLHVLVLILIGSVEDNYCSYWPELDYFILVCIRKALIVISFRQLCQLALFSFLILF